MGPGVEDGAGVDGTVYDFLLVEGGETVGEAGGVRQELRYRRGATGTDPVGEGYASGPLGCRVSRAIHLRGCEDTRHVVVADPRGHLNGLQEGLPPRPRSLGTYHPHEDRTVEFQIGGEPLLNILIASETYLEPVSGWQRGRHLDGGWWLVAGGWWATWRRGCVHRAFCCGRLSRRLMVLGSRAARDC